MAIICEMIVSDFFKPLDNLLKIRREIMKKLLNTVTTFSLIIPLLIALFYSSGVYYYHGYFEAFGVPYGLFSLNVNDLIHFGGLIMENPVLLLLQPIFMMCVIFLVAAIILDYLIEKFDEKIDILKNKIFSKKTPIKSVYSDIVWQRFVKPIYYFCLLILAVVGIFAYAEMFSSEKGKEAGYEIKKHVDESFNSIKKGEKPIRNNLYKFKIGDHEYSGYLIHSDANYVALYTVFGLAVHKVSQIDKISNFNYQLTKTDTKLKS